MNKIQVNHTPDFIKGLAIAFAFLWIISTFIICYTMAKLIAVFLSITILLIIIGVGWCIDYRKTTVEYDAEKIHWKWLWLDYKVNFSDIDSVNYTIIHQRTRYGYNHRFEIVFQLKDCTQSRLNDSLESEDIENCINDNSDNIKLMKLYKFIENIYPEKSGGFIKTSDEMF